MIPVKDKRAGRFIRRVKDGGELIFHGATLMIRTLSLTCVVWLAWQTFLYGQEAPAVRRIGEAPWRHPGCGIVAYTPKGDRLITAGAGLRVWDTTSGKILQEIAAGPLPFGPSRQTGLAVVGAEGKQV